LSHLNLWSDLSQNEYVLLQGSSIVIAIPGDAIIGFDSRTQWPEKDAGMRLVLDLLASQRDAQPFGNKAQQAWLDFGILQDPRSKIRGPANFTQPFTKAGMCFLGHADKKHRFEVGESDFDFFCQRMPFGNGDNGLVVGQAFPVQIFGGDRRPKTHEAQVNFAGFQSAKLFRRGHVEKIQGNVRKALSKRS
jgi:hypothetical protein